MTSPALSIITVVRDDPTGLAATRDSLSAQRWRDFEWLVADGGSGPATLAVLDTPGLQPGWMDSRADGGPFAGMDRALAMARGGHVLFLNAGDCLANDSVLADLHTLLTSDCDMAYGDCMEDPGDGTVRRKPARHWRWAFYGMPAHHCAIVYRRVLVQDLRLDQGYRVAGDYAFTLTALRRARTVVLVPRVIARFAPGGLSRRLAALGRQEQHIIRVRQLRMPQSISRVLYLLQIAASVMRRISPRLYSIWRFN